MNIMTVVCGVSDRFRPASSSRDSVAQRPLISCHWESVHTRTLTRERVHFALIFHDHIVQQSQGLSWRESGGREEM